MVDANKRKQKQPFMVYYKQKFKKIWAIKKGAITSAKQSIELSKEANNSD